jgi:hypothetical protein
MTSARLGWVMASHPLHHDNPIDGPCPRAKDPQSKRVESGLIAGLSGRPSLGCRSTRPSVLAWGVSRLLDHQQARNAKKKPSAGRLRVRSVPLPSRRAVGASQKTCATRGGSRRFGVP